MAHFIGSVQGGRGEATRLGHAATGIEAKVASYRGACKVSMRFHNGEDYLRIELAPHCGEGASLVVWDGPLNQAEEALRHCHHSPCHVPFSSK